MQGRLSPIVNNKIQSFPWETWKDELEIASKNRMSTVEWTIDDNHLYENPLLTEIGIKEINFLTKKYKINIPSLTGDCFMQNPFWKASGRKRKKLQNDFINILHSCSKTDISIILIPLVDNGSIENYEQENTLLSFLSSQESLLKKLSLRVCFESDFSPKRLKDFIDNYDTDLFGINYDTGNSASMGFDPKEEFHHYGDRIINIHIKDRPLGGSTVPLGHGHTNFDLIFKLLKKYGYNGNLILQTARAKNDDHLGVLKNYYNMTIDYANKNDLPVTIE